VALRLLDGDERIIDAMRQGELADLAATMTTAPRLAVEAT
jgi:hypothetical protein